MGPRSRYGSTRWSLFVEIRDLESILAVQSPSIPPFSFLMAQSDVDIFPFPALVAEEDVMRVGRRYAYIPCPS